MTNPRSYPHGVPSWIDTEQPALDATQDFYGGLFGWTFTAATPPQAPFQYLIAHLDGEDVAGVGQAEDDSPAAWHTYIAVDDADAATEQFQQAGARLLSAPADAGEGGRGARLADPAGAEFRLWQAKRRLGAQVVNTHGAWNFSDYHTADPGSISFYANVLGWSVEDLGFSTMIRRPGYADHLAASVDPGIRERHAQGDVPEGFSDAIGWVAPTETDAPHWHVSFAVLDRDKTVSTAEKLGATVVTGDESRWTRSALIRDPQGAVFTASQFTP